MPVIPRYDTAQTAPTVLPNARQTTLEPIRSNPMGELARGAGAIADVVQKAQDDADKVRVFEARNTLQNSVNDSLYGQNGVFNRKGKNAVGALGQWETDFDKTSQEIGRNLTPTQRRLYDQAAMEIRTGHRRQVLNYETDQWRSVADATYNAAAETSLNTIGLNYNNPDIINRELGIMDGAIIKKNQTAGTDAEVSNLERAQWASKAHAQVAASALTAGNVKYAKEYFDTNRDKMLPQERLRLEATINAESDKQAGLGVAMETYQKYSGEETLDIEKMMNEARTTLKDRPDALAVAEREIKSMVAEREVSRRAVQDKALDEVTNAIVGVRSRGRVPSIKDVPTKAFLAMDAEKKNSVLNLIETLQNRAQAEAKERKNEAEKVQEKQYNMQAAARFYQLVNDPDMRNKNLLSEASSFLGSNDGERYFNQLVTMQRDLRKGKAETLTQIQTDNAMVKGYLDQLKIKDDSAEALAAYDTFQRKLTAFETNKGGKATPDEKRRMAQDMFIKREIVTPWFSGGSDVDKAPFQMSPDEIGRITSIANIPKKEQDAIKADYQAVYGKQPTDAEVVNIYKQSIQGAR